MSDLRELERAVRYGRDGRDGRDGVDGLPGEPGLPGPRGLTGEKGIDGKDGRDGRDGIDGVDGMHGKDGAPGIDGKDGAPGMPGPQGETGPPGPPGPRGDIGPMPRHQWDGTSLRFEAKPNQWGEWVDLRGPAGRAGAPGLVYGGGGGGSGGTGPSTSFNTVLNGSGEPSISLGHEGDFYIDTATYIMFGPKTAGSWGEPGDPIRLMESMLPETINDNGPFEWGMKLLFERAGYITAVRFYKGVGDTGGSPRIGHVWNAGGTELATATFDSETASGWQEAAVDTPLAVNPADVLWVSVNLGTMVPFTTGGLNDIPASSDITPQGAFYGPPESLGSMPTNPVASAAFFVDCVFVPSAGVRLIGPRGMPA